MTLLYIELLTYEISKRLETREQSSFYEHFIRIEEGLDKTYQGIKLYLILAGFIPSASSFHMLPLCHEMSKASIYPRAYRVSNRCQPMA